MRQQTYKPNELAKYRKELVIVRSKAKDHYIVETSEKAQKKISINELKKYDN